MPSPEPISPAASDTPAFHKELLQWYDAHARDLPWRQNRDPYRVWISEIMLQQTRVPAVLEHFHDFFRRFPTIEKLAAAREATVLAAWSGLGYYRRARMLHAAAKVIVREQGGAFPQTDEQWRTLPGVGRYTAAAIASIAFGQAVAVVDGNVERVLQRISGERLSGEDLWRAADNRLDRERPGDFNQAMMELGSTVCTPRAPACLTCPVIDFCATRGEMPPLPKATSQQKREIHYVLAKRNGAVLLVQRPNSASLMAGMWELPELRSRNPRTRSNGNGSSPLFSVRHSITVTDYTVRVWNIHSSTTNGRWISVAKLPKLALTGLARKILRKADLLA